MWNLIFSAARTYAPFITLPFAAVIGIIGYNIEWTFRKEKNTPFKSQSILEERNERELRELESTDPTKVELLKSKKDMPKTVLGRNENFGKTLGTDLKLGGFEGLFQTYTFTRILKNPIGSEDQTLHLQVDS
ncbi:Small integral membrane protein 12-B [Bulinus truncatus]|nr:Small integral membrane protein 12-B [Bulinus truncatus]